MLELFESTWWKKSISPGRHKLYSQFTPKTSRYKITGFRPGQWTRMVLSNIYYQ